jgi:hypothetical protein
MKLIHSAAALAAAVVLVCAAQAKPPGLAAQANLDVIGSNLTISPAVASGYAVFWVNGFYVHQHAVWAGGALDVMYIDPSSGTRVTYRTPVSLPVVSIARRLWTPRGYNAAIDVIAIDFGSNAPLEVAGHSVVVERIESKWLAPTETLAEVQDAIAKGVPALIAQSANELDTGISLSGLIQ